MLNFEIKIKNKMYFLRSEGRTDFELNSINISGLNNLLYLGMLSSGNINNSRISSES